ncbi:SsrA-binding protein SmpB [Oceanotoga sp. DSM 15011]|jgi:SsrA-binding protein|uniref:SsrA-binding protein n=1 Tax=Oceanotoga teriensis TaxID=515440 RepID=A0AA45C645_9BACT|nr:MULTISPECIES: SsrA-binding protein SmpB [Oceanotoga]MDN5341779.1 SsrA-binding protein [Oceanotoga sp.]MDO7975692.1 SsrA-binding protein SmpB [Oceanotoga teriensis]PWJ90560.1 SsrA-binding protein [Oceanotoga teriensis]UYO99804.1 SsrA-binding protein SmpB [Oceanotoga sp. DSM 15011]
MKIITNNKKAYHDYFILDKFEAGISLTGSEVKSIKNGHINIKDSYCKVKNREAYLNNANITPYGNSSIFNHEPLRQRKLLLHKEELRKIQEKLKKEKLTIIPLKIYITEKGLIKLEIGLAKGKKQYDKRETLAKKDFERKMKRTIKYDI